MKVLMVLTRSNVPIEQFEDAVAFYQKLYGTEPRMRTELPEQEMKFAQICSTVVVGLGPDQLAGMADIHSTYLVDNIEAWAKTLPDMGAQLCVPLTTVPTGQLLVARHPDGCLIEYIEHNNKHPLDRMLEQTPAQTTKVP